MWILEGKFTQNPDVFVEKEIRILSTKDVISRFNSQ